MTFAPVRTKADLDTLNSEDIIEGYKSAERGDPEPGENRGRAFWHGWRNRMMDIGQIPHDDASRQLVREVMAATRDIGPAFTEPDYAAEAEAALRAYPHATLERLVGIVMQSTRGKANPALVREALKACTNP